MEFDWPKAIAKNRDDLIAIVTRLFVMAGIRTGVVVDMLPRHLRIRILALLRPAEYAARRLIVMAALRIKIAIAVPDEKAKRPTEDDVRCGASRPPVDMKRDMAFPLFDPFKSFGAFWIEPGDEDEDDEPNWMAANFGHDPYEHLDAHRLIRRIKSLEHALQDLDAQALRLARWRARRKLDTARPRRFSPIRPGRPPGWKKRPKTAIEEVLRECHFLAVDAWKNTS